MEIGSIMVAPDIYLMILKGCGTDIRRKSKSVPLSVYIARAMEIHGDLYDYSEAIETTYATPNFIICPIKGHGIFKKSFNNHIGNKQGCPLCGNARGAAKNTMSQEEFVERVITIHGDNYDLSGVQYTGINKPVAIICNAHSCTITTNASNLVSGKECCTQCAREKHKHYTDNAVILWDDFLSDAINTHNGKYEYEEPTSFSLQTILTITCPTHGVFTQRAVNHRNNRGCRDCGIERSNASKRLQIDEFIQAGISAHGDVTDYAKVEYTNTIDPVLLRCKIHDIWYYQQPWSHMIGCTGCPNCSTGTDADVIYIWRVSGLSNIYKIGITSKRLGRHRLDEVARKANFGIDIITITPSTRARFIEELIHKRFSTKPNLGNIDGKTEFRVLTDVELGEALSIIDEYR